MKSKTIPQKLVEKMSASDRQALGLSTNEEKAAKHDVVAEKEIQSTVEGWLRQRGYWPRSDAFLDGRVPERGWYIHIQAAKRNPIVLDLLILNVTRGDYLELELKTASGPIRPAQLSILKCGSTDLARSAMDAIELIKEWERAGAERLHPVCFLNPTDTEKGELK